VQQLEQRVRWPSAELHIQDQVDRRSPCRSTCLLSLPDGVDEHPNLLIARAGYVDRPGELPETTIRLRNGNVPIIQMLKYRDEQRVNPGRLRGHHQSVDAKLRPIRANIAPI
jgi:hypothetical protein